MAQSQTQSQSQTQPRTHNNPLAVTTAVLIALLASSTVLFDGTARYVVMGVLAVGVLSCARALQRSRS
ncbi:hypothetical protein [Streptomyces sp. NBC_01264]|uniref:hypothetical protein n=1 Tax=Streptomyces sp. NBC_01264 TaxID=2903804 RepID=UPI0022598734|nr:hypothetical protein [Streptomyces sp. NBC_01264]MCX4783773.1 hypothetical protein [Streptomyces sp. NBC_01264]